ncbi:MAG TPA: hypothetical protein VKP65_18050 [Rhodothermales bacterium]|nr:hypothetical protein [Rhodothermales bacterium]
MPDQAETSGRHEGTPEPIPEQTSREKEQPSEISGTVTVRLRTIANLLTAVVALAAILLSVWEGIENRRHNRLSVLPHLKPIEATYGSATPIDNKYFLLPSDIDSLYAVGYALENSGLGPAVLENVLIFEGEEKVFDSAQLDSTYTLQEVKRDLARLPFAVSFLRHSYAAGDMLQAGEVHPYMTVVIPFASLNRDTLNQSPPDIVQSEVLERRSFVFCYCSVYREDCDVTYLGAIPPAQNVCGF